MATVPLHPEIEPFRDLVPIPDLDSANLTMLREMELGEPPELSDEVVRTEHTVLEDEGVFVRVHTPNGLDGPAPCVYAVHGGGYVAGTLDQYDAWLDRWCPMFGVVGVSVEYRLAPEAPYPAPLEDCYAGLRWTFDHADELGIDPSAVGITGVSAGGGLCAGLALLVRDRGEMEVQFQLLDCPMVDDRQVTPSSRLDDLIVWSKVSNEFGWRSYLGDLYGSDDIPGYAAAARAEDLSGLPPAYVCVGGADGFRDEDVAYAMRLYGAGVPTDLRVHAGAPHGAEMFVGTSIAERYGADKDEWLGSQIERLR